MSGKKKAGASSKSGIAKRADPEQRARKTSKDKTRKEATAKKQAVLADAVNAVLHPARERGTHAVADEGRAAGPVPDLADVAPVAATSASRSDDHGASAVMPDARSAAVSTLVGSRSTPGLDGSEADRSAARPGPAPQPDFEALSRNLAQLIEESGQAAATMAQAGPPDPARADIADAVQTLGQVAEHWFGDPARLLRAQTELTAGFFDLWAKSAARMAGRPAEKPDEPAERPADKRFRDPEWRENPVFDFVHKAFLLGSQWANGLVEGAEGLDEPTREKARFYMRQITSAMSPSNFVPTNPELLRETVKENGGNLLRGMRMLAQDVAAGQGQLRIRQSDTSKFALGVNMALTPGKVVYRNDLMELLQYAPATPQVLKRPLLIVPPWINKFYVLDLNPEKSFIRWAVEQGLTVFLVSWVNPDARHAAKDFEAYMREGILTALDEIAAITGEADATAIGYCVGGTLLAVTLAHMVARGDNRISSATLFTAQVDFTHAGDLKVFADESQIRAVEAQMTQQGYLRGSHMAQAFNMLRPEDLIWSYWVNNYLRGKEPPAFDLLAWNSDSTRMPAANHSFYLRNCYLENNLARGLMEIAGERLDLGRVTAPIYNLATREDHIAPALSVFEGSKAFGGPVRFVLSGSGHVAGVVNPPHKAKYGYVVGDAVEGTLDAWLSHAKSHTGSWWTDWIAWIKAQNSTLVDARVPGGGRETLEDAPGSYVRVKA